MHQAHNKECRKQLVSGILYYVCLFLKTVNVPDTVSLSVSDAGH